MARVIMVIALVSVLGVVAMGCASYGDDGNGSAPYGTSGGHQRGGCH